MARLTEQRSFHAPQEKPFFPKAEPQPREDGPKENTISAETFLRDQVLGYLDELELQQRVIPLHRESLATHRRELNEFTSLLQRSREILLGFEIKGRAPKSFGGHEKIQSIHQRLIALEAFIKDEQEIETVTHAHQEAGGVMEATAIAEAQAADRRMQKNPELIPEYIQTGRQLKALEQEQKSATIFLQKRFGGDMVTEELLQLAEDPTAGLSMWRRGWDSIRHAFDRNYVTTTQLLTTYQETFERKRALEHRQQIARQQIEGTVDARPVSRQEKNNPELTAMASAAEVLLPKFENAEKRSSLTGEDWERLALLTSKLEDFLPKERIRASYQNYKKAEKTFSRVKAAVVTEQARAQKDLLASKGDLTDELIDRELALFAPPATVEKRLQSRHLNALTQFNPILEELTTRIHQFTQKGAIEIKTIESLKQDLAHVSPEEQRAVITLVQRRLEHEGNIHALSLVAGEPGVIHDRTALQTSLKKAHADVDISRLFGIEVIPPSLPDTRKKNTTLRLTRLIADMEQDLATHPEQGDEIYTRLSSIWMQMPVDITSEDTEERRRLEALFTSKTIQQCLARRKKTFLKGYLATTISGSYRAKRSVKGAIEHLSSGGTLEHLANKYKMPSPEVTEVLTEEMQQAPLKLLPEDLRAMIPVEFEPYAESIYRTFKGIDPSKETLRPDILTDAEEKQALKYMEEEEQVPSPIAQMILQKVITYREKERRQFLEEVWQEVPSYVKVLFSKDADLHLAPLLLRISYLIVQKHKDLGLASHELLNKVSMDDVLQTAGTYYQLHNNSATIHKRKSNSSANTLIFNPAFESVSRRIRARFQKRTAR